MNRNRFKGNRGQRDRAKNEPVSDSDNPVVQSFLKYASELSDKHDRYERIVKLSRDITIESKRLIFLLHTIDKGRDNKQKVLDEAKGRLLELGKVQFAGIARELKGIDQYQYTRAYSAGVQEFVEACTYYDYLSGGELSDWIKLQRSLTYKTEKKENSEENADQIVPETEETFYCLLQPIEFMLGLADVTGEVMRKCINSLGSGDIDACFNACSYVQSLYSG